MASEVEICNGALIVLGADTIMSLTDDSERAKACNARYEEMRDQVLESHGWKCAITRQSLAQSADTPEYGWLYQYQLPTLPKCLRVLELEEEIETNGGYSWDVEDDFLVTDAETATIQYIYRLTDPEKMTPLLRQAISTRLAAEIAYKVTGSKSMVDYAWKTHLKALRDARLANAIQSGGDELHSDSEDSWLSARS